ncbi:MAG: asparagine synthase (glutamine-hydrolyzing) [Nanohaloarchaea archaeon]|nr:asparagine synthase (glutamine-hydrolyzing) [Candidatus Nanohaloarchaea archaeon]
MCGIYGFNFDNKQLLKKMSDVLKYRGPDQKGFYSDKHISMGHNRLSILDLSENGKEPMSNEDGSIQLTYNGELYNFKPIRSALEKKGHRFKSDSDAEVVVHAYEEYGTKCLEKFRGMFAFALWDQKKRKFFLARDRLGIKPLYYYHKDRKFIFASEIKAIIQDKDIERKVNLEAMHQLIASLYPFSENTLMQDIYELPPGHFMIFHDNKISISRYWSLHIENTQKSEEFYIKKLKILLQDSVKLRMISDVPLGATLSGGLDSSIITTLMSRVSDSEVNTYTAGFGDSSDEFAYANMVSEYAGTNHKELYIDFKNITKELPKIIWNNDTVLTRTAAFPLYFLSKELKKNITVAMVGEGSDELFGGYPRYKQFSPDRLSGNKSDMKNMYRKIPLSFFRNQSYKSLYSDSMDKDMTEKTLSAVKKEIKIPGSQNYLNKVLSFEIQNFLPKVHLLRVDRMTMSNAIEARVPYLDHKFVEFSMTIPSRLKMNNSTEKYILKKAAAGIIPKEIINRKKVGMQTPLASWFQTDFKEYIPEILSKERINDMEFLRYSPIQKILFKSKTTTQLEKIVPEVFNKWVYNRTNIDLKQAYFGKIWFLSMLALWYEAFIKDDIKTVSSIF